MGRFIMTMLLKLENVQFSYQNSSPIFNQISMQIKQGEWICLLGGSGIGKTTLLRIIETQYCPQQGTVYCHPNTASVFQNYTLFPHLNVCENITLILRRHETWLNAYNLIKK